MNFRVGQMVRIVRSSYPGDVGKITRVTSGLELTQHYKTGEIALRHDLELPNSSPYPTSFKPENLEPYHEPGDYQTLAELLRGVVPAGVKETT